MNYIETIYCSQYYELKKTGRDPMKGRTSGTMLVATMILLLLVCAGVIIDRVAPHPIISRFFIHGIGEGMSGRSMGKLIGLVGLVSVGGLLHFTYGSETRYKRMSEEWDQLPDDELNKTPARALKIFFVVFGAFLLVLMLNSFM